MGEKCHICVGAGHGLLHRLLIRLGHSSFSLSSHVIIVAYIWVQTSYAGVNGGESAANGASRTQGQAFMHQQNLRVDGGYPSVSYVGSADALS